MTDYDDLAERLEVGMGDYTEAEVVEAITDLTAEVKRLKKVIFDVLKAYDGGSLELNSPRISSPENGVPMHPWHEEWLYFARQAIKEQPADTPDPLSVKQA